MNTFSVHGWKESLNKCIIWYSKFLRKPLKCLNSTLACIKSFITLPNLILKTKLWHIRNSVWQLVQFSSVQLLTRVQLLVTPWIAARQASLSITQLPEFTQTHVHRVGDAIQPSHPLSSPSPPAPNLSQHQGLFQWVNSLHEVAEVLEFQL